MKLLILILFFINSVNAVLAVSTFSYGREYAEDGESFETYPMSLDGRPYLIIVYTENMVVYDLEQSKPLFDYQEERPNLNEIFRQEYYHNHYANISTNYFKELLAEQLNLDASFPCKVINADKILFDKTITTSEDMVIKSRYIPEECVEAPINCKEIANNIKRGANYLAKIDNYGTPQIILAVYCEGESKFIIPKIIAPAREIDAIIQNIKNRAYLTGQLNQMNEAKSELQSQLSYGSRNFADFGRDGYFAIKDSQEFLHKMAVITSNVAINFANVITNWFGKDISDKILDEPEYWSERLSKTRELASHQFTSDELKTAETFSTTNTRKSIKRLTDLSIRNKVLIAKIQKDLGNLWLDWHMLHLNSLIYDYDTTSIKLAEEAQALLSEGIAQHNEYRFGTAYETLKQTEIKAAEAIEKRNMAEQNKKLNLLTLIMSVLLVILIGLIIKNRRKETIS